MQTQNISTSLSLNLMVECLAEVECGVMLRYQKAQIKLHRYLGDLARNAVYLMF